MNFLDSRRKAGAWAFFSFGALLLVAFLTPLFESPLMHQVFSPMCHQKAERCYHYHGTPWPLCVRCVAIYAGIALGGLIVCLRKKQIDVGFKYLFGAVAVNFLDFALEQLRVYDNLFATRVSVGLFLGLSITFFCLSRVLFASRLPKPTNQEL